MMKKILVLLPLAALILLSISVPLSEAAVSQNVIGPITLPSDIPGRGITNSAQAETKINAFVRGGIRIVFLIGLVGVLFFFSIGGIRWVFSAGDKQKIDQAKGMITAAIVGFAILALSYTILYIIGAFFGIKIVQEPPKKSGTGAPSGPIPSCSTPSNQCVPWNNDRRSCQMAYGNCEIKQKFTGGSMKYFCCPPAISP
jgi:cbb3-type cytochrome oxidase subunit 3